MLLQLEVPLFADLADSRSCWMILPGSSMSKRYNRIDVLKHKWASICFSD
jgi:hypothetical protein